MKRCEACGHPVIVVGSDEGTQHYEPIEPNVLAEGWTRPDSLFIGPQGERFICVHLERNSDDDKPIAIVERVVEAE